MNNYDQTTFSVMFKDSITKNLRKLIRVWKYILDLLEVLKVMGIYSEFKGCR